MNLPKASVEENVAADAFRKTLIPRADDPSNLLWHGWALFDAFIAGIRWQQQRSPTRHWGTRPSEDGQP